MKKSNQEILKKVYNFVKDFYSNAQKQGVNKGGHGFDHTERVVGFTIAVARKERVNIFLPVLSALIHDLGRASNDLRSSNYHHGELSWEFAKDLITSLPLNPQDIILVKNAVEDHPRINQFVRESYLVKILMDADRQDLLGATGTLRSAAHRWYLPLFPKKINTKTPEEDIETIYQDIAFRIPDAYDLMWTEAGKKMGKNRVEFTRKFIKQFEKEVTEAQNLFDSLKLE